MPEATQALVIDISLRNNAAADKSNKMSQQGSLSSNSAGKKMLRLRRSLYVACSQSRKSLISLDFIFSWLSASCQSRRLSTEARSDHARFSSSAAPSTTHKLSPMSSNDISLVAPETEFSLPSIVRHINGLPRCPVLEPRTFYRRIHPFRKNLNRDFPPLWLYLAASRFLDRPDELQSQGPLQQSIFPKNPNA